MFAVVKLENCVSLAYYASSGNYLVMFRSHLQGSFLFLVLEDGTDRLSQKSVRNYHYSLHNNPEERSSHLLRGGSLISHVVKVVSNIY